MYWQQTLFEQKCEWMSENKTKQNFDKIIKFSAVEKVIRNCLKPIGHGLSRFSINYIIRLWYWLDLEKKEGKIKTIGIIKICPKILGSPFISTLWRYRLYVLQCFLCLNIESK